MARSRKVFTLGLVVLMLLLGTLATASAVTNGVPDGDEHPYVGLIIFDVGDTPTWRCSGTLISPTVVLTAGHCTDGADAARVFFGSDLRNDPTYPFGGATAVEGTPYTHPDFCIGCGGGLVGFASNDVGVVVLDEPVTNLGYGQLPESNLVDTLAMRTPVDLVGYGVQFKQGTGVPPSDRWAGLRMRMYAPSLLVASENRISDSFIKLTANPAQDKGGTCFGDSGGPDLLGNTNVVLAVNSFVTNYNCAGVTYSQRVDVPDILEWIQGFLE